MFALFQDRRRRKHLSGAQVFDGKFHVSPRSALRQDRANDDLKGRLRRPPVHGPRAADISS